MIPIGKLLKISKGTRTAPTTRTLSQPTLKPEPSQPASKPEPSQYEQERLARRRKEIELYTGERTGPLMRMGQLSGAKKYPILHSNLLDEVTPVNPYSKKFTTKRLMEVGDDTSQGYIASGKLPDDAFTKFFNSFVPFGYFTEPDVLQPSGIRFIQDFTPAKITSLGPKIFTKADSATAGQNLPYSGFANLQGYLNMDELHKLALGGDDIANQIYDIYAKEGRGLLARLQYMQPRYQHHFAELGGNISSHPSSIQMESSTIGPASNSVQTVRTHTPLNPEGNKQILRKHGEFPLFNLTPKEAKRSPASYYGDFQALAGIGTGPIRNTRLDYWSARDNNIPLTLKQYGRGIEILEPIMNDGAMDIASGFHEGIHALNNDARAANYHPSLPPHLKVYNDDQNLLREGVIRDARIYAADNHPETTRALAFAKDPVTNSIRYRVEKLAPELIPDWNTKSTAEQNRIIAEIVFDKSENAFLSDRILRQWENAFGGQYGSVIPASTLKFKDPTYALEVLRSLSDIRDMRPTSLFSAPAKPVNPVIEKLINALPENLATKLPRPRNNNASLRKYYTFLKKIWPQIAPAITATAVTPTLLDMLLGGNDTELN